MSSCNYAALVGGLCGPSSYNATITECTTLGNCDKDVFNHLSLYKVSDDSDVSSESKLLLARAGIFDVDETHLKLTICPLHRDKNGIRWRSNKTRCAIPEGVAAHKSSGVKGQCGVTSSISSYVYSQTDTLIPVGTLICKTCKSYLIEQMTHFPVTETTEQRSDMPEIQLPEKEEVTTNEEKEYITDTSDEIIESMKNLAISDHDDTLSVFSPDTMSTASSSGDASDTLSAVLALNNFLKACQLEPILKPMLDWDEVTNRTQRRYVQRACDVITSVLNVISPSNAAQLWKALQASKNMSEAFGLTHLPSEKAYLDALAEAYKNADGWDTRRQVLSTISDVASFDVVSEYIPELTRYRYTMANLHRLQHGRSTAVPVKRTTRLRISPNQLEHFLSFITSPHIVQDLPFGEKQLKMSSGKAITVPNIIRTMVPERIVVQYSKYCDESHFKPFSRSTMLRILDECSASVRKSLQGLDYFAAQGTRAFDDLSELVQTVSSMKEDGENWAISIQDSLKVSKLYLKGDYKLHVSDNTQVADHCYIYALSDKADKDFKEKCNHEHKESCEQCNTLDATLKTIEDALDECEFSHEEDRDECLYLCQSAKRAIHSWKSHQLRSVRQDQARLDMINLLDVDTVWIVNDWAMKFLPRYYRESQSDWFGKRGISWHISVVFRRVNGELQSQAFVHIIDSCSQDSSTIIVIMQHVLKTLETENPEIRRAFFRQDNAGCYHSAATILACQYIERTTEVKISRIDFSDPQGGKGPADRLAARCKCHIRLFVNEGNDVTNASEMKDALLSNGGVEGVRIAVVPEIKSTSLDQLGKLPGISKLNNFEFQKEKIIAWRGYNIGKGKTIKKDEIQEDLCFNWIDVTFSPGSFKSVVSRARQPTKKPSQEIQEEIALENQTSIYSCPQEGCVRVFQRSSALEKHLSLESCTNTPEKQSMLDLAKERYACHLKEDIDVIPTILVSSTAHNLSSHTTLEEGWSLKGTRKNYRFNAKQKTYLTSKFNIGQQTGHKLSAEAVSKDMRRARGDDGKRLFIVSEFLSAEQISSFFSRMATKVKNQVVTSTEEDARAATEEDNYQQAKESVMSSLGLQHPIIFDQYNVCQLVKDSKLNKLKLDMLCIICQELGLDVPAKPAKRKAPYLLLLEDIVASCTCNQ